MKRLFAFVLILILFLTTILVGINPAYAQNTTFNPQLAPVTNPDVPQNLHTFTQGALIEILSAASCLITGVGFTDNGRCLGIDANTGKLGYVESQGGAIGLLSSNLGSIVNSVNISSSDYFAYLSNNFGVAKHAYAQSTGFQQLMPVITLWQTTRNISYLLIVIVFIIIGLGIMLRIQIDPRTVMTIQNQIPKAIVGILLVTFSYAIVGFMVDIMWVSVYFIMRLFAINDPALAQVLGNTQTPLGDVNGSPLDFVNVLFGRPELNQPIFGIPVNLGNIGGFLVALNASYNIGRLISDMSQSLINSNVLGKALSWIFVTTPPGFITLFGCIIGGIRFSLGQGLVVPTVTSCIDSAASIAAGVIGGIIAFLIVIVALFIALVRLWISLIKSMVFIYIDVIFAPLWIMSGVLPGVSGFGSWIRDVIANLAAFPVAIIMFLIAKVLMDAVLLNPNGVYFMPPLIGNIGSSSGPAMVVSFIAFGLILMTPSAVQMAKDVLRAPSFKYVSAIGASMAGGSAIGGRMANTGWNRLMRRRNDVYGISAGPLRQAIENWGNGPKGPNKIQRLVKGVLDVNPYTGTASQRNPT